MEDPNSVFDFPIIDEDYCEMCGCLLDYHERLGICYECEMSLDENYSDYSSDED
jgi:hypothetical protein